MKHYKITAKVYDKKGRLLSKATNSYKKTHPLQYKLACKVGKPHKVFLHAEIAAIVKALKKGTPYKISVERYDKHGNPKLAKPCPICMEAIKLANIEKIEYTI